MLVCAVAGTIYLIPGAREFRRVQGPNSPLITPAFFNAVAVGSVVNAAVQLLNFTSLFWEPSFAAFYRGLVWLLVIGVAEFIRILLIRPPRD